MSPSPESGRAIKKMWSGSPPSPYALQLPVPWATAAVAVDNLQFNYTAMLMLMPIYPFRLPNGCRISHERRNQETGPTFRKLALKFLQCSRNVGVNYLSKDRPGNATSAICSLSKYSLLYAFLVSAASCSVMKRHRRALELYTKNRAEGMGPVLPWTATPTPSMMGLPMPGGQDE
jgi:hypothetical protein